MFLTIGLVLLVHSCCSLQQVQTDTDAVLSQNGPSYFAQEIPLPDSDTSDNYQIERQKRALGALGSLTRAGVQFVNFVLKGAQQVPTDKIMREKYAKPGGVGQLKKDFYKFSPLAVRRFKLSGGGEGKAVKIGDRIAIMKTKGESGNPSLEVFKASDVRSSQANGKSLADLDAIEITYLD